MREADGSSLQAEANTYLANNRVETGKVRQMDAPRNALTALRDSLRAYKLGVTPLNVEHMMQMCNAGLA